MKKYDHVFVNGKIFTSDPDSPYAQAMAIKDGRIAFIGSDDGLVENSDESLAGDISLSGEKVTDLSGKRVLPGFVDSHIHPIYVAENLRQILCLPPRIRSIDDLKREISLVRKKQGPGRWVMGWGYDESQLSEGRAPTRYDLDEAAADVPVCIIRSCAHTRCANSKALAMAGITRDTPDPEGGEIARDENGEPTGVLIENAWKLLLPVLPVQSPDEVVSSLLDLSKYLASQGITAMSDMGNLDETDYYDIYAEAMEKGFCQKLGIFYMWDFFKGKEGFSIPKERCRADRQLKVQGIKILSDGGISAKTAWVDRPYVNSDGNEYGVSTCTDEDFLSAIEYCKANGLQLAVHAMGQRAIDRAVDLISASGRWSASQMPYARIEHASMPTRHAIETASRQGIAFVTQPVFLYAEVVRFMENMGPEWFRSTFPIRDMLDSGIQTAFSTDSPATPLADSSNPFITIKAAVTRRAIDGTDCGQAQAVDTETAIRLYTAESAKVMGFADTGMLRSGYKADFIILDKDILSIPPDEIDTIKVEDVYIDGKQIIF